MVTAARTPSTIGTPVAAVTTAPPDPRIASSDALLIRLVDAAAPGCSAAGAVHGEVVWASAHGVADLATGAPLTTTTRFDMASLTKQFTATAVLTALWLLVTWPLRPVGRGGGH